jgi:hypothetical protein
MLKEHKEKLERIKNLKVIEGVPDDLRTAIESFLEQAVIVGKYELDYMPGEYIKKLLKVCSKYPEYNDLLLQMINIVKRDNI